MIHYLLIICVDEKLYTINIRAIDGLDLSFQLQSLFEQLVFSKKLFRLVLLKEYVSDSISA
jgi:hypothetical protein